MNIDPNLETPSKHLRLVYSALGLSLTASLLVSKTWMMSAYKIAAPVFEAVSELPQPDWSLLHNPPAAGYQSCDALRRSRELTESLNHSCNIIQAYKLSSSSNTLS
jgi:hypothetical protein